MNRFAILGSGILILALGGCQSHPQIVHDKYTGTTACVSGKHTEQPGLLQTLNTIATYTRGTRWELNIIRIAGFRLKPCGAKGINTPIMISDQTPISVGAQVAA